MLKDLKLDRAAFINYVANTINVNTIADTLEPALEKLAEKTHTRRHRIFEAKKNIDHKIDVDKNKEFIEKATSHEEAYPRERRLVISRCIMDHFVAIAHNISEELLKDG